jgi:two-component system chemotaxis response regulator CheY
VSRTALVVDDSPVMRELVAFTLGQAGFHVVLGEHGQDGLDKLAEHRPHLIITDLNMPVMDGFSFIRKIRAIEDLRFLPVLMLTTESDEARRREGKAAGATGWVTKPFHPAELLRVIAKVLP